jgi:hypothetical protein
MDGAKMSKPKEYLVPPERIGQPPAMADYDKVILDFKDFLRKEFKSTEDNVDFQTVVIWNFLFRFVPAHGLILVQR